MHSAWSADTDRIAIDAGCAFRRMIRRASGPSDASDFCKMPTCATFLLQWRVMISLLLGEAALDIPLLPPLPVQG
jgi:hypothetical protein